MPSSFPQTYAPKYLNHLWSRGQTSALGGSTCTPVHLLRITTASKSGYTFKIIYLKAHRDASKGFPTYLSRIDAEFLFVFNDTLSSDLEKMKQHQSRANIQETQYAYYVIIKQRTTTFYQNINCQVKLLSKVVINSAKEVRNTSFVLIIPKCSKKNPKTWGDRNEQTRSK